MIRDRLCGLPVTLRGPFVTAHDMSVFLSCTSSLERGGIWFVGFVEYRPRWDGLLYHRAHELDYHELKEAVYVL
jgi:hypothetical protein